MAGHSLASLPTEIILNIGTYLDEDDLLALRMSSRECNAKARESHLDALYNCRAVFFTPFGLENLVKVAEHPSRVNLRVRCLRIFPDGLNYTPHDASHAKRRALTLLDSKSEKTPDESMISEMFKDISTTYKEQSWARTFGNEENCALLTRALFQLPKITSIYFYPAGNIMLEWISRSQFNLLFPSAGIGPGQRIPASFYGHEGLFAQYHLHHYSSISVGQVWIKTVSCIVSSGLKTVQRLCYINLESTAGTPLDWFDLAKAPHRLIRFRDAFPELKKLDLDFGEIKFDGSPSVFVWIEAVGQKIEELKLSFLYWTPSESRHINGFAQTLFRIPENLSLPSLKSLKLINVSLEIEPFALFLEKALLHLRSLHLDCCFVEREEAHFTILKLLRQRNLIGFYYQLDCSHSPKMCAKSLWENTTCTIHHYPTGDTIKDLAGELDSHSQAKAFWESITDGKEYWD